MFNITRETKEINVIKRMLQLVQEKPTGARRHSRMVSDVATKGKFRPSKSLPRSRRVPKTSSIDSSYPLSKI